MKGIEGSVCLEFAFVNYKRIFPGTGWREINGKQYYFKDYKMVKDTGVRIGEEVYFFDKEGNGKKTK